MMETTLKIPTLTTERLKMEPISMRHSPGMYDLWADTEVCKYSGTVKDYDGNVIETPVAGHTQSDLIIDFWLKAAANGVRIVKAKQHRLGCDHSIHIDRVIAER